MHCLKKSISRCSVSAMPSINFPTVLHVQKLGAANTLPNRLGDVIACVSEILGMKSLMRRCEGPIAGYVCGLSDWSGPSSGADLRAAAEY